jgi:hypothetical protein
MTKGGMKGFFNKEYIELLILLERKPSFPVFFLSSH